MKRITLALPALLLVAGLSGSLSGCDAGGDKPRIGVALCNVDDSFVAVARRSLEAEAQGKARISILDGQNQQVVQNGQVDAMIADKAKAMIVNLIDTSVMRSLVFMAKAGGVPVVIFGRDPSVFAINAWDKAFFVGTDSTEAADIQVQILAEYWKAHLEADKDGDGSLSYVLLQGDSNKLAAEATAEKRDAAFAKAEIKGIQLATATAKWNRMDAQAALSAIIEAQGVKSIEAVLCSNDEMALGAVAALKLAGLLKGGTTYVPVIGIDGTRFALDAIADGSLLGTVRCDAAGQGKAAFAIAYALAKGQDPAATMTLKDGKFIVFSYVPVTQDNYSTFKE